MAVTCQIYMFMSNDKFEKARWKNLTVAQVAAAADDGFKDEL